MGIGAAIWQELVAGSPGSVEIARIAVRFSSPSFSEASWASKEPMWAKQECEPTCS